MLGNILNIVVTAASGYIVWLLQEQRKERISTNKATSLLLRRELNQLHEEYLEKETITSSQYSSFYDIYKTYHDLGGNGTADRWFDDIKKMKVKD